MALFQSAGNRLGELRCLRGLALSDISTRVLDRAAQWIRAADEIERSIDAPLTGANNDYARGALLARADNDYVRGALERVLGRYADAEASMWRSFRVREQVGDRSEVLAALCDLAEIATLRGDLHIRAAAMERFAHSHPRSWRSVLPRVVSGRCRPSPAVLPSSGAGMPPPRRGRGMAHGHEFARLAVRGNGDEAVSPRAR